ncbi:MAG: hypothetical protein IT260_23980 [Saprospiraceae bacterium]|nr:hypothetical protein [Saprospiraceae bacterium]
METKFRIRMAGNTVRLLKKGHARNEYLLERKADLTVFPTKFSLPAPF